MNAPTAFGLGSSPRRVGLLYNQPVLAADDPDWASEAGVLETVEAVTAALGASGHEVIPLPVTGSAAALVEALSNQPLDVVFNLCEGLGGTGEGESQVAGLVELCGLPMTGAPSECLSLVRDKARTKWLLQGAGLPTPPFFCLAPGDELPEQALRQALDAGPWIVKPAREDASLGLGPDSVVSRFEALRDKTLELQARYGQVLVERFIAGRELNAGIVELGGPRLLPLSEILFQPGDTCRIVTYDAKWSPESRDFAATPVACPADLDPSLAERIGQVALAAFKITGCRDYARVDLRIDADGSPWILEINANPDLSPSAGLARAIRAAGIEYDEFPHQLVEQAWNRHFASRSADAASNA